MEPAGKRDRRIRFQRAALVTGDDGVKVESWTDLVQAWALVMWGKGAERREAGAQGAAITATFRVVSTSMLRTLTERDRIVDQAGRVWNITSVAEMGRAELDITAINKAS